MTLENIDWKRLYWVTFSFSLPLVKETKQKGQLSSYLLSQSRLCMKCDDISFRIIITCKSDTWSKISPFLSSIESIIIFLEKVTVHIFCPALIIICSIIFQFFKNHFPKLLYHVFTNLSSSFFLGVIYFIVLNSNCFVTTCHKI